MSDNVASDLPRKPKAEEEIEAYFAGYEQTPLTADELDLINWGEKQPAAEAAEDDNPTGG